MVAMAPILIWKESEMSSREIEEISDPIDVQFLMHKAYEKVSLLVEGMAHDLQQGGDMTTFKETFALWGKHLQYHAATEDEYMTGPIRNDQAARNNEVEHEELASQARDLAAFLRRGDSALVDEKLTALLEFEEKDHQELAHRIQMVEDLINEELGEGAVSARARRNVYSRVVALRVCEFDHFDNEEIFVLPVVRSFMDEKRQLAVAKQLLFEQDVDNPRWIIDLIYEFLGPGDQELLKNFEHRISSVQ